MKNLGRIEKNVGHIDKLVRLIFALVFFIMGALYNTVWLSVSLLLLLTAVFGTCGVYYLFGFSTCQIKKKQSSKRR